MPSKKGSTPPTGKGEGAMGNSYTATLTVDKTPEEAYAAINDVRGWWAGNIEGSTDQLGAERTYRYENLHYSKQRITELVPGRRVPWMVVDSSLSFIKDQTERNGAKITFDISKKGDTTEIRFTHHGLVPQYECFNDYSDVWGRTFGAVWGV
jgi:hypothetical protein